MNCTGKYNTIYTRLQAAFIRHTNTIANHFLGVLIHLESKHSFLLFISILLIHLVKVHHLLGGRLKHLKQ